MSTPQASKLRIQWWPTTKPQPYVRGVIESEATVPPRAVNSGGVATETRLPMRDDSSTPAFAHSAPGEEWRAIPGCEPCAVSSAGRVRGMKGHVLRPWGAGSARRYLYVGLGNGAAHPRAKLTAETVARLRGRKFHYGEVVELATRYGVSASTIHRAASGRTWAES